jgi:hypothetical protein
MKFPKGTRVTVTKDYPAKGIEAGDTATVEHSFEDDSEEYARHFINVLVDRLPEDHRYNTVFAEDLELA